jgi:hypothetical protein
MKIPYLSHTMEDPNFSILVCTLATTRLSRTTGLVRIDVIFLIHQGFHFVCGVFQRDSSIRVKTGLREITQDPRPREEWNGLLGRLYGNAGLIRINHGGRSKGPSVAAHQHTADREEQEGK